MSETTNDPDVGIHPGRQQQEFDNTPSIANTLPVPTEEHIAVYRTIYRLAPDEELHVWRDDARWLQTLADAEAEEYPEEITKASLLEACTVIEAVDRELAWRDRRHISRGPIDTGVDREWLTRVKAATRIEDEISTFVELRRSGRTLRGPCPIHGGTNRGSLTVWPDEQRFYCYTCNARGDIVNWLQLVNRWTFRDAVVYLTDRAGLEPPSSSRRATMTVGVR